MNHGPLLYYVGTYLRIIDKFDDLFPEIETFFLKSCKGIYLSFVLKMYLYFISTLNVFLRLFLIKKTVSIKKFRELF